MIFYFLFFLWYFGFGARSGRRKDTKSLVKVSAKLRFSSCWRHSLHRPSHFLSLSWDDGVKACTFLSKRRSAEKWSQLFGFRCLVDLYYIQATGNDRCSWKETHKAGPCKGSHVELPPRVRIRVLLGNKSDKIALRKVLTTAWNKIVVWDVIQCGVVKICRLWGGNGRSWGL